MKLILFLSLGFVLIHFSAYGDDFDKQIADNLPSKFRHTFSPIDPTWHSEVIYHLGLPPYQIGQTSRTQQKLFTVKEVQYKGDKTETLSGYLKSIIYYPNGSVYDETDYTDNNEYERTYFSTGQPKSYTAWDSFRWEAGVAFNPLTHTANSFSNGNGQLTTYEEEPGRFETTYYQDGIEYLSAKYEKSQRVSLKLRTWLNWFLVTKDEEKLNYMRENWVKTRDGVPNLTIPQVIVLETGELWYIGPYKSEYRELPPSADSRLQKQIQAEWTLAYPLRRKTFLDEFETEMIASKESWKSLGIDFLPDNGPWPNGG